MNNYKVDYPKEDVDLINIKKILLWWVAKNHPEIVNKVHDFVKKEAEKKNNV